MLGPAGIGKSRLVREFVASVAGRAQVLSGRCLSYGEGITFWPIAEMAIQAAGIAEDDPPERARAELRELLEGTPDGETVAAHLSGMLGLDGSGPVEPPWAVRRVLEVLARRRPLVAGSMTSSGQSRPSSTSSNTWVRGPETSRSSSSHGPPRAPGGPPGWGGGQRNATTVLLEPLPETEAHALIHNLIGHPAPGPRPASAS